MYRHMHRYTYSHMYRYTYKYLFYAPAYVHVHMHAGMLIWRPFLPFAFRIRDNSFFCLQVLRTLVQVHVHAQVHADVHVQVVDWIFCVVSGLECGCPGAEGGGEDLGGGEWPRSASWRGELHTSHCTLPSAYCTLHRRSVLQMSGLYVFCSVVYCP